MFGFLNLSEPYIDYDGNKTVMITVKLDGIVDDYEYHDFPSEVWLWVSLESIESAIKQLIATKLNMQDLDSN